MPSGRDSPVVVSVFSSSCYIIVSGCRSDNFGAGPRACTMSFSMLASIACVRLGVGSLRHSESSS
jgi:hypothetical protein